MSLTPRPPQQDTEQTRVNRQAGDTTHKFEYRVGRKFAGAAAGEARTGTRTPRTRRDMGGGDVGATGRLTVIGEMNYLHANI